MWKNRCLSFVIIGTMIVSSESSCAQIVANPALREDTCREFHLSLESIENIKQPSAYPIWDNVGKIVGWRDGEKFNLTEVTINGITISSNLIGSVNLLSDNSYVIFGGNSSNHGSGYGYMDIECYDTNGKFIFKNEHYRILAKGGIHPLSRDGFVAIISRTITSESSQFSLEIAQIDMTGKIETSIPLKDFDFSSIKRTGNECKFVLSGIKYSLKNRTPTKIMVNFNDSELREIKNIHKWSYDIIGDSGIIFVNERSGLWAIYSLYAKHDEPLRKGQYSIKGQRKMVELGSRILSYLPSINGIAISEFDFQRQDSIHVTIINLDNNCRWNGGIPQKTKSINPTIGTPVLFDKGVSYFGDKSVFSIESR